MVIDYDKYMEKFKEYYFNHIKLLRGKEFVVRFSDIWELLDEIICENCPVDKDDCEGWCVNKWDKEFDEQYEVKIKIVDFMRRRKADG